MILQERIEELGSGILIKHKDNIELIGFMSPERLQDYYYKNIQCFCSHGFYSHEELNFGRSQDNSLFVIIEDGNEVDRYNFQLLKKGEVKFKTIDKKYSKRVFRVRKCKYTNVYNYVDTDENLTFNTLSELANHFNNKYKKELNIGRESL